MIRERDLLAYDVAAGTVTFGYQDAQTGRPASRTLSMADFLWRVLLHVLPTGFRRVRDYGFLHGNAATAGAGAANPACAHPGLSVTAATRGVLSTLSHTKALKAELSGCARSAGAARHAIGHGYHGACPDSRASGSRRHRQARTARPGHERGSTAVCRLH